MSKRKSSGRTNFWDVVNTATQATADLLTAPADWVTAGIEASADIVGKAADVVTENPALAGAALQAAGVPGAGLLAGMLGGGVSASPAPAPVPSPSPTSTTPPWVLPALGVGGGLAILGLLMATRGGRR